MKSDDSGPPAATPHTPRHTPIAGHCGDDATKPAPATATTSDNATNIPHCRCSKFPGSPAGFHVREQSVDDAYEDDFPDDAFERDDPFGTGLWGNAMWTDDEPWSNDLEGPWDDIRLRKEPS